MLSCCHSCMTCFITSELCGCASTLDPTICVISFCLYALLVTSFKCGSTTNLSACVPCRPALPSHWLKSQLVVARWLVTSMIPLDRSCGMKSTAHASSVDNSLYLPYVLSSTDPADASTGVHRSDSPMTNSGQPSADHSLNCWLCNASLMLSIVIHCSYLNPGNTSYMLKPKLIMYAVSLLLSSDTAVAVTPDTLVLDFSHSPTPPKSNSGTSISSYSINVLSSLCSSLLYTMLL